MWSFCQIQLKPPIAFRIWGGGEIDYLKEWENKYICVDMITLVCFAQGIKGSSASQNPFPLMLLACIKFLTLPQLLCKRTAQRNAYSCIYRMNSKFITFDIKAVGLKMCRKIQQLFQISIQFVHLIFLYQFRHNRQHMMTKKVQILHSYIAGRGTKMDQLSL